MKSKDKSGSLRGSPAGTPPGPPAGPPPAGPPPGTPPVPVGDQLASPQSGPQASTFGDQRGPLQGNPQASTFGKPEITSDQGSAPLKSGMASRMPPGALPVEITSPNAANQRFTERPRPGEMQRPQMSQPSGVPPGFPDVMPPQSMKDQSNMLARDNAQFYGGPTISGGGQREGYQPGSSMTYGDQRGRSAIERQNARLARRGPGGMNMPPAEGYIPRAGAIDVPGPNPYLDPTLPAGGNQRVGFFGSRRRPMDRVMDKLKAGPPGSFEVKWESSLRSDGRGPPKYESKVTDSRTDQAGLANRNEFKWDSEVADQLYRQTMAVLDPAGGQHPDDVERMISGLADAAVALDPEAQWSLNKLAELTSRLEQVEQSWFPTLGRAKKANEIRKDIRRWAKEHEKYAYGRPGLGQGMVGGSVAQRLRASRGGNYLPGSGGNYLPGPGR